MYYEYPIEQLACSARTRFQLGFARMTMHLMPELGDAVLEPSEQGLRILGASEMALTRPGEIIRQLHEYEVELKEPRVRLLYDVVVREPIMRVRASVCDADAEAVVQDLAARDARIDAVDWGYPKTLVRAQAPLRNLLGYSQALANLSKGATDLRMWLSHYAAIPPGPEDEAA
jgi:predicted membrane GTPase involved in stress response